MLTEHREILNGIMKRAPKVYPLEDRKATAVDAPLTALALCSSQPTEKSSFRVSRGEKVSITAKLTSDWTVKLANGKSGKVPSIIVTIQPPSNEALDFAKRYEF